MTVMNFWTPTQIPIDAFMIMSATQKFGPNPIGRFGTGLKYAIAVILRHGGKIRLYIGGVEYEFYIHEKDFRGKQLQIIRIRKKNGIGRWLQSKQLPFTTHLGYAWELWGAFREIESNTRDESGTSFQSEDYDVTKHVQAKTGTLFQIDCPGFIDAIADAKAFLDTNKLELLVNTPLVRIYNAPSEYLYCEGIRVYTTRYPSKLTYDFASPFITLTEDRTIGNLWSVLYDLSRLVQGEMEDVGVLQKIIQTSSNSKTEEDISFEGHELTYYVDKQTSDAFKAVSERANLVGRVGPASRMWYNSYSAPPPSKRFKFELSEDDYELLKKILTQACANERNVNKNIAEGDAIAKLLVEITGDDTPW